MICKEGGAVLVFLLVFAAGLASAGPLTGLIATQLTNVSILILPATPSLTIYSPINGTYLTNESLLLGFTSSPADNYWYNLNNGPNYTTYLPGGLFNVSSEGSYTLFLYANKSGIVTIRNVTFNVNLTKFIILYEEYKGIYRGNSTDFYSYPYEQMFNMSDIVLENTNYGKIYFIENITLPYDANPNDGVLDLDLYTNISYARVEINGPALPNFDVGATIWFYNLPFINPRILRDGALCGSCIFEDYTNGVLRISVPGAGVYTIEEISAPIVVGAPRAGSVACTTGWICTNWTECINGTQTRTCQKEEESCYAEYARPPEQVGCEEEKPGFIEIEFPISPDCCLCGICWFRFIVCWYWWLLLLAIVLSWFMTKEIIRRLLKEEICPKACREDRILLVMRQGRGRKKSEEDYLKLAYRRNRIKKELKELRGKYSRGLIARVDYEKRKKGLLRKLRGISSKLSRID